jgi:hypothetical protein
MKVIVSHDVDHLYSTEHLFDGVLVKFAVRAFAEWVGGGLSTREYKMRMGDLFRKQWHHIDELMDFDETNGIPSTFFFAMAKGKGLNYNYYSVAPVIRRVMSRGFDCGVHGIGFKNQEEINAEYQLFMKLTGLPDFGIRMHYLKKNEDTLEKLNQAGYRFDSSESGDKAPHMIGNMWEFPLHIMDSNEFYRGRWRQTKIVGQIIDQTKITIEKMAEENYSFVTLLYHDRYFSSSYESYQRWYFEVIHYLKKSGHSFISYREALKELSLVS